MTHFEFIAVFISILLALGVSDVLNNWGDQIRRRDEIDHYWLHTAWGGLYLLAAIQAWWGLWRLRDRTEWTFGDNLILILPYMVLALVAYVLTPSSSGSQKDIREYYWRNSPWFFGLCATFLAALMINTRNIMDTPTFHYTNYIRTAGIALMIALAVSRNEKFHKAAVLIAFLLLTLYIARTQFSL